MPQVIMGLDPGSRITGVGIIRRSGAKVEFIDAGLIRIPADKNFAGKLLYLEQNLNQLFNEFKPDDLVVEKIFLGKNADSAFKLGHVRGVALLAGSKAQIRVTEYAARKVKKSVTGSGAASKEHVGLIVGQLLGLTQTLPLDASDALALALCHCNHLNVDQLVARQPGVHP